MGQQASTLPFRFQYVTPAGETKWTEPVFGIHAARILGAQLVADGNKVDASFHDYVGGGYTEGTYCQYAPPAWTARLAGRRVC